MNYNYMRKESRGREVHVIVSPAPVKMECRFVYLSSVGIQYVAILSHFLTSAVLHVLLLVYRKVI